MTEKSPAQAAYEAFMILRSSEPVKPDPPWEQASLAAQAFWTGVAGAAVAQDRLNRRKARAEGG